MASNDLHLIAHQFNLNTNNSGLTIISLFFSVAIPCVISDVAIPNLIYKLFFTYLKINLINIILINIISHYKLGIN